MKLSGTIWWTFDHVSCRSTGLWGCSLENDELIKVVRFISVARISFNPTVVFSPFAECGFWMKTWEQTDPPAKLLTSEACICRCLLSALLCQVKTAKLPAAVRVSSFRWGRRNSKLFALCTCTEILPKFTDFSLMFFFCAFITTLKINTEKASIPNVLRGTWQRDVFLSCTGAPVLLAWLESKEREI